MYCWLISFYITAFFPPSSSLWPRVPGAVCLLLTPFSDETKNTQCPSVVEVMEDKKVMKRVGGVKMVGVIEENETLMEEGKEKKVEGKEVMGKRTK